MTVIFQHVAIWILGPVTLAISAAAAQVQGAVVTQGGESLPATGSDSAVPIAQIGIALVVAGAAFALFARKRSATGASESVS